MDGTMWWTVVGVRPSTHPWGVLKLRLPLTLLLACCASVFTSIDSDSDVGVTCTVPCTFPFPFPSPCSFPARGSWLHHRLGGSLCFCVTLTSDSAPLCFTLPIAPPYRLVHSHAQVDLHKSICIAHNLYVKLLFARYRQISALAVVLARRALVRGDD
ncbi:hypothetical protein NA56DRAFT_350285 [Hyaloscypha hepaticicola]|uniref:Secreted protein n=1 Tax=Hyaloscypha hepaticicola TaxID=2082293 RepID=A0A2J6PMQ2_9HELO|nr:hypothetical protein NA56DRAFT_350285 [Hyaloscypha hepaticicola]